MPGPPPKDPSQRRRQNRPPELLALPSEGRKGDSPKWPLSAPNAAEKRIWAELWVTPQAVMWERLGWVRTVAKYARAEVEAEQRGATSGARAEARQLEDRLGLTPLAMLRLRWRIAPNEVAEAREWEVAASPDRSRRPVRAVDPAAGDG